MTLQQAQTVTGGMSKGGNPRFAAVSTDTRTLRPGELFIALKGPSFDGNRFLADAARAGACAALVSEPAQTDLPTLQVTDTRIALGQLGAANRRRSAARIVGLTGSQGKTSVKEMTTAILAQRGAVLSTRGNLNNDFGVPLTLLSIEASHQFAVIEMGANAAGEIAYTTALARPHIAHITNVAATHLAGFGSLEGVGRSKAEIWQGLPADGTAVLNLDDEQVVRHFPAAAPVRRVGISANGRADAEYALEGYTATGLAGSACVFRTPQGLAAVSLQLPGRHNAANALAATALAMEAGAGLQDVISGLAAVRSVKGRMNIKRSMRGAMVIDDSYNASPASFQAAIAVLAQHQGTRIVVAGDMGELGHREEELHAELGRFARDQGVEHFIGTGRLSGFAVAAFGPEGVHAADWQAAVVAVQPLLTADACVLVKGSRSAGMERVVQQLVEQEN